MISVDLLLKKLALNKSYNAIQYKTGPTKQAGGGGIGGYGFPTCSLLFL